MLFCRAYPVKKMVPLDRIASGEPCLGADFEKCPFYRELMARLQGMELPPCAAREQPEPGSRKVVPR